jgi:hypothetical protein
MRATAACAFSLSCPPSGTRRDRLAVPGDDDLLASLDAIEQLGQPGLRVIGANGPDCLGKDLIHRGNLHQSID